MKASEMTNEDLANLIEEGCGTSLTGHAVREAAARLRRVSHKRKITEKDAEIAELRTLLASTVGYTCTLCGMKSSKMCGTCAVFKAQEILEGGNDEQH